MFFEIIIAKSGNTQPPIYHSLDPLPLTYSHNFSSQFKRTPPFHQSPFRVNRSSALVAQGKRKGCQFSRLKEAPRRLEPCATLANLLGSYSQLSVAWWIRNSAIWSPNRQQARYSHKVRLLHYPLSHHTWQIAEHIRTHYTFSPADSSSRNHSI
jgi:hypothetical protein